MDAVVDLGQGALEIPPKQFLFLLFKPLKLLDEVEFKNRADGRTELKGDIFVRIGSPVTARFYRNADGSGFFDSLSRTQNKTG